MLKKHHGFSNEELRVYLRSRASAGPKRADCHYCYEIRGTLLDGFGYRRETLNLSKISERRVSLAKKLSPVLDVSPVLS